VEGPEAASIILVGYRIEVRALLRDFAISDAFALRQHPRVLARMKRLATSA
jgi:hypothetical protein